MFYNTKIRWESQQKYAYPENYITIDIYVEFYRYITYWSNTKINLLILTNFRPFIIIH